MIPHRHRWITARSLDVCRWCLRRRSPRDGFQPRIVLKERIDMSEGRVTIEGYLGVALLGAIALIAVLAFGLATRPTVKPAASKVQWQYGPRVGPLGTGQKGVVVFCQDKTNAPKFLAHEHARPGDVAVRTCRAVKG